MFRQLALILAIPIFAMPGSFRAFAETPKKDPSKEEIIRPSFAENVSATVERGGETVIALRARVAGRETRYLIRTQPAQGRLGEVRVSETGTATVEYFSSGEGKFFTDHFTYAVQNLGASMSARAEVQISIVEAPPKIVVTREVDFGRVAVGGATASKTILLVNSGGTPYTATPQISSPWSLQEDERLLLLPGQSREITILFKPDSERSHKGTLFFKGPPGVTVGLKGEGITIFDVQPLSLSVEPRPAGGNDRTAEFFIGNKTGSALAVEIQTPETLEKIPVLALGPHEERRVPVRADPSRPQGGRSEIRVAAMGASSVLEARITPLPARVICEQGDDICLGAIPDSGSLRSALAFRNDGGINAAVTLKTPSWLVADPDRFILEPGSRKTIDFLAIGLKTGRQSGIVEFSFDESSAKALVSADSSPDNRPVPTSAPVAEESVKPNKSVDWGLLKTNQLVVFKISGSPEAIEVLFRDPYPEKRIYRVERMRLTSRSILIKEAILSGAENPKFDPQELAAKRLSLQAEFEKARRNDQSLKLWLPVAGVSLNELQKNVIRMTFPPAKHSSVESLRITPIDPQGKESQIRTVIRVPIDRKRPPWSPAIVALGIAATIPALIAVLLFVLKLRRKQGNRSSL